MDDPYRPILGKGKLQRSLWTLGRHFSWTMDEFVAFIKVLAAGYVSIPHRYDSQKFWRLKTEISA